MEPSLKFFFRVIYAAFYTFLHLLLVALFLVTPADIINQSRLRHNLYPILIVAICYVASIILVIFIYFLRLYINRSVLNSIPKSWIPIEKGDVRKPVRKMIAASLSRSAAIALVSQPRLLPPEQSPFDAPPHGAAEHLAISAVDGDSGAIPIGKPEEGSENTDNAEPRKTHHLLQKKTETIEQELGIGLPPCKPVWGKIEHFGWAPPDAGDMGDLQYSTVLAELPNLIEAKALTLAPPDPMASPAEDSGLPPPLDPEAVLLLQRPVYMGVRDYIVHLTQLGVINLNGDGDGDRNMAAVVASFASTYEYARFSTHMLSHASFQQLMHDLATILRRMGPLDPALLFDDADDFDDDGLGSEEKYGEDYGSVQQYPANYGHDQYQHSGHGPFEHNYGQDRYMNEPTGDYSQQLHIYKRFSRDTDSGNGTESDIDNNAARSSPTTPRSASRRSSAYYPPSPMGYPQQPPRQRQRQRSGTVLHHSQPVDSHGLSRSSSNSSGYSAGSSIGTEGTSRHIRRQPQSLTSPTSATSPRQHHYDTYLDLPTTPKRRTTAMQADNDSLSSSSSSSANSFVQTRQPFRVTNRVAAASSQASLQSASSNGSVIRLADRGDPSGLPYVLNRTGPMVHDGT